MILLSGSGDTVAWFRLDLLKDFQENSYEVFVLAPDIRDDLKPLLDDMNIHFIPIKLQRKGFSIINLILSIIELRKLFILIKPDLILSYTHKAIVGGSIAARLYNSSNSHSLITGTGHLFDDNNRKEKLIKFLGILILKLSLKFNKIVFFQNPDDRELFLNHQIVTNEQARLVNGSGINLEKFKISPLPPDPVFLCMARLIKSKGLIEYAQAAKLAKQNNPKARFLLYGYPDYHKDSIDESEIKENWFDQYGVEYFGYANDPIAAIQQSNVFVLLSYKEGTPRVVLEAMALGRPIISTRTPGCKETVIEGINGFLVPKYDFELAAKAMINLMNQDLRLSMGAESRAYCEEKFDVKNININMLREMQII